jgi:uncharacterized protein
LDDRIFYVGKGTGSRLLAHARGHGNDRTSKLIAKIRRAGLEPRIDVLAHGLPNEQAALRVEAAVIDAIGRAALTNDVGGWGSVRFGRHRLTELVASYARRPAKIREAAILIRITHRYRPDLTPVELYDGTRSAWVVGQRREAARFAFAVNEGVVREVYEIARWFPGGTTLTSLTKHRPPKSRWEFVGRLAPKDIRRRYIGRYVGDQFRHGAQNPIAYVNC